MDTCAGIQKTMVTSDHTRGTVEANLASYRHISYTKLVYQMLLKVTNRLIALWIVMTTHQAPIGRSYGRPIPSTAHKHSGNLKWHSNEATIQAADCASSLRGGHRRRAYNTMGFTLLCHLLLRSATLNLAYSPRFPGEATVIATVPATLSAT
jgi:hypothetical protein